MNPAKRFEKNLSIFGRYRPDLVNAIRGADDPAVQLTENNIKISEEFLHNLENPLFESIERWNHLKRSDVTTVVVYGLGLGYFVEAATLWLSNVTHRLIILEDDLRVLRRFFESDRSESILKNPQVLIDYFSDVSQEDEHFEKILRGCYPVGLRSLNLSMTSLPKYAEWHEETYKLLMKMLYSRLESVKRGGAELLVESLFIEQNHYQNLLNSYSSFSGKNLEGKFKKVPAIICGAGPSLDLAIEELKKLENRALIFAGGTAINVLNSQGVLPHLTSGVDPNLIHHAKIAMQSSYEVPFVYSARLYQESLGIIHGPKIYLAQKGLNLSAWFDEKLGREGYSQIYGNSITTMNFYLAYLMGCDPLILLGVDMAFTGGRLYGEGLIGHPLFENLKSCLPLSQQKYSLEEEEETLTTYQFYLESHFFAALPERFPDSKVINATEGGLKIKGLEEMSINKAVETYCQKKIDIRKRIHEEMVQGVWTEITLDKIRAVFDEWIQNLTQGIEEIHDIIEGVEYLLSLPQEEVTLLLPPELKRRWEIFREKDVFKYYLRIFDHLLEKVLKNQLNHWVKKGIESEFEKNTFQRHHFLTRLYSLKGRMERNKNLVEKVLEEETINDALIEPLYREGNTTYYEDGTIKSILPYEKGVLNGTVELFYPSGKKKRELVFKEGRREGPENMWSPTGQKLMEVTYTDNRPIGWARSWFPNGQPRLEIEFDPPGDVKSLCEWSQEGELVQRLGLRKELDEELELVGQLEEKADEISEHIDALLERLSEFENEKE